MRNNQAKTRFLLALYRHRGEWVSAPLLADELKTLNLRTVASYLSELALEHRVKRGINGGRITEYSMPVAESDFKQIEQAFTK